MGLDIFEAILVAGMETTFLLASQICVPVKNPASCHHEHICESVSTVVISTTRVIIVISK